MRVIAGTARHLNLKTIEGKETRPTTDRIKETLFNMIHSDMPGCTFLDLFSGSGGIGIEALSRGARMAYFVEKMPAPARCIRENLAFTKLEKKSMLIQADVMSALTRLEKEAGEMDFIFMDPPYGMELEKQVLYRLMDSSLVGEETVIIVEADLNTDFSYLEEYGYEMTRQKIYKTNQHIFCRRRQDETS